MSDQIESFYQGESKSWTLTFTRDGSPIDLTTATNTVYMTVKSQKSAADGNATFTSTGGQISATNGAADGTITMSLSTAQTSALSLETTYYYDFRLVEDNNAVTTVPGGMFTVKEPITQAVT